MTTPLRDRLNLTVCLCACLLGLASMSQAVVAASVDTLAQQYFPQVTHIGEFEGEPLAAPVYQDEVLLGYLMRTSDIAPIPAYSGEPITLLVGLGLEGLITGLKITQHSEPILVVGISEQDLDHYVEQYRGVTVDKKVKLGGSEREGYVTIDGIRWPPRVVSRSRPRSLKRPPAVMGAIHRQPDRSMRPWRNHHLPGGWASLPSLSGYRCGVIGSGK